MATDGSLGDHSSGESTLDSSSSLGSSSGDSSLALSYASSEFEGADEPEGVHPFLYEPVTSSDDDEGSDSSDGDSPRLLNTDW